MVRNVGERMINQGLQSINVSYSTSSSYLEVGRVWSIPSFELRTQDERALIWYTRLVPQNNEYIFLASKLASDKYIAAGEYRVLRNLRRYVGSSCTEYCTLLSIDYQCLA